MSNHNKDRKDNAPASALAAGLVTAGVVNNEPLPTETDAAPLNNAAQFETDSSTDAEQMHNEATTEISLDDRSDPRAVKMPDGPLAAFTSIQFVPRLDVPARDNKDNNGVITERTRKVGEAFLELRGMPGAYLTVGISKYRKVGQAKAGIRASFVPFDFQRKLSPVMSDTDEGKTSEKATKDAIIAAFLGWADKNGIDLSKPQTAPVQHEISGDDLI